MSDFTWVDLFALTAVLLGVGWLTGRILDIRRGFWRSVVAGITGLVGAAYLVDLEFDRPYQGGVGDFLAFVGTTLLVTLLVSVMLDRLLAARQGRRPGLRSAVHAVRLQAQSATRVAQIARLARRNRLFAAPLTSPEGAHALRCTLQDAGGMLVKFGQIASTREDLLPSVVTSELAHLRTAVPALPIDVVRQRIEAELGAPVDDLFASFDEQPLAAASIGVTHRATLADGRRVIVKVQRPGIEDVVERDGHVLLRGARVLERRKEAFARLRVTEIAAELLDSVRRELDFTLEQSNNAAMRASRGGDAGVRFPEILPDLTTRRVLVMEEAPGVPVSDAAALSAAVRPRAEIADNLLRSFLAQAISDGRFHADPHPGNVLVDEAGDLWLIDYGAVGIIDPITLEALQQLAAGFLTRDASLLARGVRRMVGPQGTQLDIAAVEVDMAAVLAQFSAGGFDPAVIAAVARSLARYDVAAPRALTVLGRASLTLDGTLRAIDPDFRMSLRGQVHLKDIASADLGTPQEMVTKELIHSLPSLRTLPQLAEDLALQARAGRLTVRSQRYDGGDAEQISAWVDRVLFAAVGGFGLLGSGVLLLAAALAEGNESARFLYALGFGGLVLASAMLLRAVVRLRDR